MREISVIVANRK